MEDSFTFRRFRMNTGPKTQNTLPNFATLSLKDVTQENLSSSPLEPTGVVLAAVSKIKRIVLAQSLNTKSTSSG